MVQLFLHNAWGGATCALGWVGVNVTCALGPVGVMPLVHWGDATCALGQEASGVVVLPDLVLQLCTKNTLGDACSLARGASTSTASPHGSMSGSLMLGSDTQFGVVDQKAWEKYCTCSNSVLIAFLAFGVLFLLLLQSTLPLNDHSGLLSFSLVLKDIHNNRSCLAVAA